MCMSLLRKSYLLFFTAVVAASSTPRANAQKPPEQSAAFFKSDKILHLEIEIGKKDLDALRRDPRKYARATLKEGAIVYPDIGIHVKGAAGSFRGIDDKPGLTLN